MNLDFFKKESPLQGMMGRGGGVVARLFSGPPSGGFTVLVTPSINGQSLFNLDQEELILDGSNATDYTITVDSSSTEENGTIQVDAWGQATSDSNGGYAGGFLSMTPSTTYAAKLNAGGGTGGSSRGNGISPNGGGYAGLFNNSVSHGNSRVIAGGGGGTGSGTGGSDGRSYGFGDGGGKVGAFGEAGIRDYRKELLLGPGGSMFASQGGRGGSQSGGGSGGPGNGVGSGSGGGQLQGGNGGGPANPSFNTSGGGGGGGGYYGGGGGAGAVDQGWGTQVSASGGGGSSYVHPSVSRGQIHRFTDAGVPSPLRGSAGQKTGSQSSYRDARIVIRKAPETLPGVFTINYSGQDSVSTDGNWRVIRWTSPGSFTVSNTSGDAANAVDWLCIGGGGQGSNGSRGGGGGGGGEFKEGSSTVTNTTYPVTVGGGGGRSGDSNGSGGQSIITGLSNASAGGGGKGNSPGSGGGGGGDHNNSSGSSGGNGGRGGDGFDGGTTDRGVFLAGGGGGADFGGKGQGRSAHPAPPLGGPSPYGQSESGKGGDGVSSDLFGVGGGAGGGGGAQRTPGRGVDYVGPGGSPGGGNGALGNDGGPGNDGGNASGFGSGGGGAGSPGTGGLGSPGVVFIRYRYQ